MVTLGSVLAMAANLVGKGANSYNMTGLAQKGGAVFSHLRLAGSPGSLRGSRIGSGTADLVLGCDLVTAAGADGLGACSPAKTRALLGARPAPTAAFHADRDYRIDDEALVAQVEKASAETTAIDADEIAERILGDKMGANMFMVGYAYQNGWLPLSREALTKAIELNGAAVQLNLDAFALGRLAVAEPDAVLKVDNSSAMPETLDEIVVHRSAHLTRYQHAGLARRYQAMVERARLAEQRVSPESQRFARTVAINLAKLMSYKDEYEVARLYADAAWKTRLSQTFEGQERLSIWLAPPLLARLDDVSGRPKKIKFGPWIFPVLGVLSRLRFLRGTKLDPFGHSRERRRERELISTYEADLTTLIGSLTSENLDLAVEVASLPDAIRGFGPVKGKAIDMVDIRRKRLMARFT